MTSAARRYVSGQRPAGRKNWLPAWAFPCPAGCAQGWLLLLDETVRGVPESRALGYRVDTAGEIEGVLRLDQLTGQQRPDRAGVLAPPTAQIWIPSLQPCDGQIEIGLRSQTLRPLVG